MPPSLRRFPLPCHNEVVGIADKLKGWLGAKRYDEMELPELVTLLARRPRAELRDAFYRRLLTAKVGARLSKGIELGTGTHVTTDADQLSIPSTRLPNGVLCLVVFCDIPAMASALPEERLFALEARVVLEMARANGCGVIVQNALDGQKSWAAVTPEDVRALLAVGTTKPS
jgi:hypothetical protein